MCIRDSMGTDLPGANPRIAAVECPYTGERLATVPALNPDVTIVHAQRADEDGNTQVWGLYGVQKEAAFEPHVLPVAVGTTVRWPNEDDIYHNVFSMSDTKEFDLGLYKKEKEPGLVFDKAGRVDVFCGIHSKMHCIVLVVPNPYFAKADAKRRFVIRDVPAGTYKLRAWHERLPSRTIDVVVPESGEVKVDFVLGLGELPKY